MYNLLRKLAKNPTSINIFMATKELHGIQIFNNVSDFSRLQKEYLSLLYMYYNIILDIDLKKVSKKVLDNEIYEDSYIYWKSRNNNREEKDNKKKDVKIVFSGT